MTIRKTKILSLPSKRKWMNKKVKIMKLGDDMKHGEAVHIWLKHKRMEGTPTVYQGLFSVKNQSSCIKGCMKKASFKQVVAGNGGSANGTVLETYHCKVKKCQQIEVVKILSLY